MTSIDSWILCNLTKRTQSYVKGPNLLILQASHPVALEPADIGGKHKVISFYDIYDEAKLREQNGVIVEKLTEVGELHLRKALQSLAEAKKFMMIGRK